MSVNQLMFLLLVFASLFVYYLAPKKAQWGVLLVISLYFYHLLGVDNFFYIILSTIVLYIGTTAMTRRDEALSRELKEQKDALTREEKKEKKGGGQKEKRKDPEGGHFCEPRGPACGEIRKFLSGKRGSTLRVVRN